MQKTEMDMKTRVRTGLINFLQRYRYVLLGVLIALSVFIVGYFIWAEWSRRVQENATVLSERVQQLYDEWQDETDPSAQEERAGEVFELVDIVLDKYPRQYAAQRSYFVRASMAFEKGEWEQAAEDFEILAQKFPKGYMAPLALFNAAISYEELFNDEQALTLYRKIVETYPEVYLTPHALFSSGRLSEQQEDFEAALAAYNQLEDEFPLSNWTKLGRNRIIALTIKGSN